MSSPLNFKQHSSGGAYGTHPGSNSSGRTRQRRNPADNGLFSSPHGSFDDPAQFPPYAELPFTSLKRRRQLQDNNSFVKWVMRGVLLSPVVVLVLWSIAAVTFANNHQIGHSVRKTNNNAKNRNQSQKNRRMIPNNFGNGQNYMAAAAAPAIPQQQLQDQQGNLIYNVNGNAMMMAPQQIQQQLQVMNSGQVATNNLLLSNAFQQQQGGAIPMQPQGKPIPVFNPLGNSLPSNVVPANNQQQGYSQIFQQTPKQAGAFTAAQPQQVFLANNQAGVMQTSIMTQQQQQQQMPLVNLDSADPNVMKQPSMGESDAFPNLEQLPLDGLENKMAEDPVAMQQGGGLSGATQDQLQASPAKQAVYFYDPKDTKLSDTGVILQMPTVVYDTNGKAVPLEELRHQAPVYVQAPVLGASSADAEISDTAAVGGADSGQLLVSSPSRGASLVSPPSKEAAMSIPDSLGTATAQDQTIIVATVAVMALLVGALSARRLRTKSFLSACIENESLEDDAAYDDAYTTTAAASSAMGADSSYNTFGGWKGDLEKFDV